MSTDNGPNNLYDVADHLRQIADRVYDGTTDGADHDELRALADRVERFITSEKPTHRVKIDSVIDVLVTGDDDDPMLAAAAVGHNSLIKRDVTVTDLANGRQATFAAEDCREWFA